MVRLRFASLSCGVVMVVSPLGSVKARRRIFVSRCATLPKSKFSISCFIQCGWALYSTKLQKKLLNINYSATFFIVCIMVFYVHYAFLLMGEVECRLQRVCCQRVSLLLVLLVRRLRLRV
nr:MAG TPA: hypothetical protein [Caudoviricetes sp.]